MKDEPDSSILVGKYRKDIARVIGMNDGKPVVRYVAPPPTLLEELMNQFLQVYHSELTKELEHPFIKSALMHMLFVKIHPYGDGNGRTARMIHNICFTKSFNHYYGMSLKISPINLSESLYINKITYANRLEAIAFDSSCDDNHVINRWFDFILNMIDEQLYVIFQKLERYDQSLKELSLELTDLERKQIDEMILVKKL